MDPAIAEAHSTRTVRRPARADDVGLPHAAGRRQARLDARPDVADGRAVAVAAAWRLHPTSTKPSACGSAMTWTPKRARTAAAAARPA